MSPPSNRNAKVYFRVFPTKNTEWDLIKIDESTIYTRSRQDVSISTRKDSKFWEFNSDGIFSNNSQESMYTTIIKGILERITKGHNGIILAFGQTGSGKSFTLGGLQYSEVEFGIAPRVILDIFKLKQEFPQNVKMSIQMSYTEFLKSNVIDLFKEYPNDIDPWHVKKATRIKVNSEFEALKLLYKGEGRKTFANNTEYMSHIGSSILTFHITTANQDFTCPEKIYSRLHIIDLAGVDSVGNTSSNFKDPLEIGIANVTKSYLEQFILYLMKDVPRDIQIRERTNPLIYFLGNDLSNESILRFIGHIRVQKQDLKITTSTLRFGQLVRGLKPKIKKIKHGINEEVKLQYLQNKLENLQKEKIFNSVLLNQDLTTDLNQNRIDHLQVTVEDYLRNHISELNVLNVAEATEVFKLLKNMHNASEEEKNKASDEFNKMRRSSKCSSKASIKASKSNTKRQKRSRESLIVDKRTRESLASLRGKSVIISSTSNAKLPSIKSSSSQGQMKRGSLSRQPSVVITRKSLTNPSMKRESKSYLVDTKLIPDILPKYSKAWEAFTTDSKSTYKILFDSIKSNENKLKSIYLEYYNEVKKMDIYKEAVERRRNELLEAEIYQQYVNLPRDEDGQTEFQKLCEENLYFAQNRFLEQQEVVLKFLGDLKVRLNHRMDIKKQMKEEFDHYCKDHYNHIVPEISDEDELVLKEEILTADLKIKQEDVKEEQRSCIEKPADVVRVDKLKRIMENEFRKNMKLKEIKNRKWKNLYNKNIP